MGSPDFAVPSLLRLYHEPQIEVAAVISGTDKKRGRGSTLSPTPVKAHALRLGLPVIEADRMKDPKLHEKLRELNPDLFVVVAFKILPPEMLEIPRIGSVNLHASLLPAYRGAAPIHHAVMNGETQTGCTVFKLDSGVDTGGIIMQQSIEIGENETTGSVYNRLMATGPDLLSKSVLELAKGNAVLRSQDDSKATPAPKLFDQDCKVSFNRPSAVVHNHIRGLSPFPGAYAMLEGKKLKLLGSFMADQPDSSAGSPGEVIESDNQVFVKCNPGFIGLDQVKYEGKKQMEAADFFRGFKGSKKLEKG